MCIHSRVYLILIYITVASFTGKTASADEKNIKLEAEVENYFTVAKQLEAKGDRRSIRQLWNKSVKPLMDIAEDYSKIKRYDEALAIYKRLYEIQKRHYGERSQKSRRFLSKIAYVYQLAGRHSEQAKMEQEMLDYLQKYSGGTGREALRIMMNLAFTYKQGKAYAKSEELYLKTLKIHDENNMQHRHTYNKLLYQLASLYIDQGDYAKAEPYYKRSLGIKDSEEIEVTTSNITRMFNYAFMLQFAGKYAEAEILYKKMHKVAKNSPLNFGPYTQEPMVRGSLGNLYRQMGAYKKSLKFNKDAYESYKSGFGKAHPIVLYGQANLAETYLAIKQYDKALELFNEAALYLEQQIKAPNMPFVDKNYVLPNLALTHAKMGQYAEAEKIYTQVIQELSQDYSERHPLVSYSQTYLAEVYYHQGNLTKASELCLQALGHAVNNKSPYLLAKIYFILGKIRQKQNLYAEAIFYGKQGVNKLQQIRSGLLTTEKALQKTFIEAQQQNYEVLAGWLVDAGRLSEAEQVLAMLKEEEYFNFIRRSESNTGITEAQLNAVEKQQKHNLTKSSRNLVKYTNELADKERTDPKLLNEQDKKRIKELRGLVTKAEKEFQAALVEIKKAFASKQNIGLAAQLDSQSYDKLMAKLGNKTALMHFLPLNDDLRIILRLPNLNIAKKVPIGAREFNRRVGEYKILVRSPRLDSVEQQKMQKLSQQLYQWLFQPVDSELQKANIDTVMLYKNGILRYIPLATLHDGKQYLIEKYALNNYTAAAKQSFNAKLQKTWSVAGLGVSKKYGKFAPLSMVKDELDGIVISSSNDPKGIFKGEVFINEAFTQQQFKTSMLSTHNVGHVATHYKFEPGTEADSFLLMGDGSHLTLAALRKEKYDFNKIDLLTLSACETAVSNTASDGREVEGLATLVQRQGAKAVMATLWPVADCSTGQFMQRFYQHRSNGMSKAAALRQSQLDFIQNKVAKMAVKPKQADKGCQPFTGKLIGTYQQPYFWAPFILMGNWL